jgi:phosphoribosylanthranilate isomerase
MGRAGFVFRIKICGVTQVDDARRVAVARADAVGLNFCSSSPRCVTIDRALEVATVLPNGISRVGVFVDSPPDKIAAICRAVPLDAIQLHGDEPPEWIDQLGDRTVIKAFRCGPDGVAPVADYLQRCRERSRLPDAVLVDAYAPGQHGGTGKVVNWDLIAAPRPWLHGLPLVLAGGLQPDNVAAAIAAVGPAAVDTASGVELAPGRKDPQRLGQFVERAAAAFQNLDV